MIHCISLPVSINPDRLILVYSTGRCGSTLLSHALNVADGVVSFSEPAFYTQLVALRAADAGNEAVVSILVRDCTKVFCSSAHTAGSSAWGLKFRGFDIELGDLFYRHFPQASVVFLYRHAEAYFRSGARAFRLFEPDMRAAAPQLQQVFSQLIPLVRAYTEPHTTTISPVELSVCLWVSAMQRCLNLQHHGIPMLCARYEDMQTAPQSVLAAVFEYCGLSVSNTAQLDRVLARDSQRGTNRSQATVQQSSTIVTAEHVAELYRLLQHYAPEMPAGVIVPHTFLAQQT